ncbi:unnamed protein product [Urochloa decumbens]|uniref:Uncharacterized protein n=1 Tax=Urochloa decumbens TaxID=240449 RepID=A0ABC9BCK1_9POAL
MSQQYMYPPYGKPYPKRATHGHNTQLTQNKPPTPEPEVHVKMEEMLRMAAEKLESDVSTTQASIPPFPHYLQGGIGGAGDRYVEPSVVTIGPCHRDMNHLARMRKIEEVKKAVAYNLCGHLGISVEKAHQKIVAVAGEARRCYDATIVSHLSDNMFADMMFVDGCFLLSYMLCGMDDRLLVECNLSAGPSFRRDIFLLENQIPWLVLDALMGLTGKDEEEDEDVLVRVQVRQFVERMAAMISPRKGKEDKNSKKIDGGSRKGTSDGMEHCKKPPHLLGFLRLLLIRNMPQQKRESEVTDGITSATLSIGAIELVQSGVKLTTAGASSKAGCFADMDCQKLFLFGKLSLSPLVLDDTMLCWLVNMVALESSAAATTAGSRDKDGYVVSSYLSMLAMLMDREEDVHELRRSGVLTSIFSNAQTLAIFKGFSQHLRPGYNYFNTLWQIQEYMRTRPVRIAVHKFVYNNYKTIAAVLSIAGALIGILKALYSLKKP